MEFTNGSDEGSVVKKTELTDDCKLARFEKKCLTDDDKPEPRPLTDDGPAKFYKMPISRLVGL